MSDSKSEITQDDLKNLIVDFNRLKHKFEELQTDFNKYKQNNTTSRYKINWWFDNRDTTDTMKSWIYITGLVIVAYGVVSIINFCFSGKDNKPNIGTND